MSHNQGIIIKILARDGVTPKHLHAWGEKVMFNNCYVPGNCAYFALLDSHRSLRTSILERVTQDNRNIVLTTKNSIYFIKILHKALGGQSYV